MPADAPTGWYYGEQLMTGDVNIPAPADDLPVWFVKAGAILPAPDESGLVFIIHALNEGTSTYDFIHDDGISPLSDEPPIVHFEVTFDKETIRIKISGPISEDSKISVTDPLARTVVFANN